MSSIPPSGTGLPADPNQPFPPVSPGPPNNRLPGWASGDMSDVRQQLLEGVKVDLDTIGGYALTKVFKATRRGSGYVWGKILPAGLVPGVTAHDIMRTELNAGVLSAGWGHMHLADMPLGSAGLVFLEDGTGNPTLALIADANVAAAAGIAYSKLNLANSIVTGDIVNGTILDADVNAAANIDYRKLSAPSNFGAPANRAGAPNNQVITTGTQTAINTFQTTHKSAGGYVTAAAGGLTINIVGFYIIQAGVMWPAGAVGYREMQILQNGTVSGAYDTRMAVTTAAILTAQGCGALIFCNVADVLVLRVLHTQGANLTLGIDNRTFISACFVGN